MTDDDLHGRPAAAEPTPRLAGLPDGARVLIVNADDLGMSRAVNTAVIDSIENGVVRSCSLMTLCPGTAHAMQLLRERPHVPVGVHLALTRDTSRDEWRPVSPRGRVPSLLDEHGHLVTSDRIPQLLARARADEVALEFRAQVDAVLDAGLAPTHLDWHCLADGGRDDVFDLTLALADEHGLAVRAWLPHARGVLRRRGAPVIDHRFLDSFGLDGERARYAGLVRDLPAGLSEWAMHPGLPDDARSAADRRVRTADHEFLTSPETRELVRREGIVVTDHGQLHRARR